LAKECHLQVVFFGTPEFALTILEALDREHQVVAVVTQPDKPKGRQLKLTPSPVKVWAVKKRLPLAQPENLQTESFKAFLASLNWEVGVVTAYGRIIPKWLLEMPPYGFINIHASLLPKYRGAAPIQRAILNGEALTGVTIMQMDAGLDTGPILMQKAVTVNNKNAGQLSEELSQVGALLINKTLAQLLKGKAVPVKQKEELATLAPPIKKEELLIDWRQPATVIKRKVQAFAPQPGAYTFFQGLRLKIFAVELVSLEQVGKPGELLAVKDELLAFCQPGVLKITRLQPAGKKEMSASEFIRGYALPKSRER